MSKHSRGHQLRQQRRDAIRRKESGLTAGEALDLADDIDLPDGAAYTFAMEMAGLEHDAFFDELARGRSF